MHHAHGLRARISHLLRSTGLATLIVVALLSLAGPVSLRPSAALLDYWYLHTPACAGPLCLNVFHNHVDIEWYWGH